MQYTQINKHTHKSNTNYELKLFIQIKRRQHAFKTNKKIEQAEAEERNR